MFAYPWTLPPDPLPAASCHRGFSSSSSIIIATTPVSCLGRTEGSATKSRGKKPAAFLHPPHQYYIHYSRATLCLARTVTAPHVDTALATITSYARPRNAASSRGLGRPESAWTRPSKSAVATDWLCNRVAAVCCRQREGWFYPAGLHQNTAEQ